MPEEERQRKPARLTRVGCLLTLVLVPASLFLGVAILSTTGIGVVGEANKATKSPVGAWRLPNGTIQQYRADGTGSATSKEGNVTYFEWRLEGDELALYLCSFADPSESARRRMTLAGNRVLRGMGLIDVRGSANYVLKEVTPEKITLAIDDERVGPPATWERGDEFECMAVNRDPPAASTPVEGAAEK